jgi:hypothetical protein
LANALVDRYFGEDYGLDEEAEWCRHCEKGTSLLIQ